MSKGDIFSDMFTSSNNSELSVVATTDCKVTFIDYNELIKECKTNNKTAPILLDNLIKVMSRKLIKRNFLIFAKQDKKIYRYESNRQKLTCFFNSLHAVFRYIHR